MIRLILIAAFGCLVLSGCASMTPAERAEYEKAQAQAAKQKAQRDAAFMLCMMQYGARNTSQYDFKQIEINFIARDLCRKQFGR